MIEIYNNAFKRLLGEKIEVNSITDCKRLIRSALISEFLLHYPQKIVAFKLNTSVPNVSVFAKDVSDMREENRDTSWVIRAALHDMISNDYLHLATSENKFCRLICENIIEDCEFNIFEAAERLKSSIGTLSKYAKDFIDENRIFIHGTKSEIVKKSISQNHKNNIDNSNLCTVWSSSFYGNRRYKSWSDVEIERLSELWVKCVRVEDIADDLGRTYSGVRSKMRELNLPSREMYKVWSKSDEKELKRLYWRKTHEELSEMFNVTVDQVKWKINHMKLAKRRVEKWSNGEVGYLLRNKDIKSNTEIAKHLGRGVGSIRAKLYNMRKEGKI